MRTVTCILAFGQYRPGDTTEVPDDAAVSGHHWADAGTPEAARAAAVQAAAAAGEPAAASDPPVAAGPAPAATGPRMPSAADITPKEGA